MGRKKKKRSSPRRLRMNRAGRLQSARQWLTTQAGRTPRQIAKSYRKWFAVDWPCAVQELEMLGIHFDPVWKAHLFRTLEVAQQAHRERAKSRETEVGKYDNDSDEYFAFIAGYTPAGFAFGITWEEWRQIEAEERESSEPECPF